MELLRKLTVVKEIETPWGRFRASFFGVLYRFGVVLFWIQLSDFVGDYLFK